MPNLSYLLFENIVQNNYCIGCGACAGICPRSYIHMNLENNGIYQPVISQVCEMPHCNLCVLSCPFWNQEMNEDDLSEKVFERSSDLKTDLFIGAYNHLISGYVKDEEIRINSSSGGLAHWLLNQLLRIGEIDYAVCVTPTPNSNVFFKFDVFSDVQGVQQSSKSCYYPVHMSKIVKFILTNPWQICNNRFPLLYLSNSPFNDEK